MGIVKLSVAKQNSNLSTLKSPKLRIHLMKMVNIILKLYELQMVYIWHVL